MICWLSCCCVVVVRSNKDQIKICSKEIVYLYCFLLGTSYFCLYLDGFLFTASALHCDLYLHISVTPCNVFLSGHKDIGHLTRSREGESCWRILQVERSSSTDVRQYWRKTMSILTSTNANTDVKHFRKNKQLLSVKDGQACQTPNHVHAAASLCYLCRPDTELVSVVFTNPWDAFSASSEQTKSLTADTSPDKNNALP